MLIYKYMKNNQKGFANIVLIIVVVAIVAVGGVYIYQNKKVEVPVVNTESPQTNQVQNNTVSSSGWGKYQDTDNGFQFNFPSNWKIVQYKTGLEGSPVSYSYIQSPDFNQVIYVEGEVSHYELKQGSGISVYAQVPSSVKTIKDLQEFNKLGRGGPAFVNERIIKVDGKDALLYDFTGDGGSLGHHLELLNNNRWIRIDIGYKGLDGKKVFDNIISTFKFTTPIPPQTSTGRLEAFEKAVNGGNFSDISKYFAGSVNVVLEGSSCCGQVSASQAIEELARIKGLLFTFNKNDTVVKEYIASVASDYPNRRLIKSSPKLYFDEYIIGVESDISQKNKAAIGYKVTNGKITNLFINVGRSR